MTSRLRSGARQVAAGAVATAAALLLGASIPLAPLFLDDYALDQLVRAVALDLRDFGLEKARDRLAFEIAAQGLEDRVHPDRDCTIDVESAKVSCAWAVVLEVPWVDRRIPMSFASEARTTFTGDLL